MFDKHMKYGILLFALLTLLPGTSQADLDDMSHLEDDTRIIAAAIGYRVVDTDDNAHRAAEYSYLDDSATFNLVYKRDLDNSHFSLTGDFNNKNDYLFGGEFDYKALFRLNARKERMYHNLDHIPYNNSATLEARNDSDDAIFTDQDTNAVYGRRITIDEVKVRGKLPTYPAHINLAFWRMEKKGQEQLRFVDESCASSCHMQSKTRQVNRVTEEFKGGIDAHLGPLDIAFLQTLRYFKEKAAIPVDSFENHDLRYDDGPRDLQHDEIPDAKLSESSISINLPPSGGFTASANYTFGKRTNESNLTAVSPVEAKTKYQKLASDLSYTPSEKWNISFRYRLFDLESDVPKIQVSDGIDSFSNGFFRNGGIDVRDSIDIDRDNYAAYISYRPSHKTTIKGEFEREVVERSDTGIGVHSGFGGEANLVWHLPSKETTDRFRLSFHKRMLDKNALKLNGWYEHIDVDNPAYGTTLTDSNEVFFSASYKPSMFWGTTGSIDFLRGEGSGRDKESDNLAIGMWFIQNEIVSADINYGYLRTNIDEDIEFGDIPSDSEYEQQVHTLAAGLNLRPTEKLSCRLEGYHIRSKATFDPYIDPLIADDDDLKEISMVDIRQNGVKARLTWKLTDTLTTGVEYTFDDYDDRNSSAFDGSAQMLMASLTGTF